MTENTPHIIQYKTLIAIWGALIGLTVVTVLVAQVDLGFMNIWLALSIASLKSALVIAIFMHMKYEGWLLRLCLFVALATLAIFIGFTFFDTLYR